ncbi:MAG TPA: adenylate/guanylate cyclase domain-containing protein [Anaerolineae bacterium]|nr:adenylate/guanylate cyclase domain-containing protein [Anaerolineae bacterium]
MNSLTGYVLVVDDNEMNRDLLTRRLERQGHRIAIARDGLEALALMRSEPFDLVLLDVMMPQLNGYETLEQMQADSNLRRIPVIMISAVDQIDSVVRCIELGAEDYLPKPFNQVLLKARIGAVLEKKRLRDQERAYLLEIEKEKRRADDLLHVLLPDSVVEELKATNTVKPRRHENVAVLFCDIVGFTAYCERREPEEVIGHLQELVEVFETIAVKHDLEKIKTIGDSFMTTAGLLQPLENPALHCVKGGLEMVAATPALPPGWQVRVGIHVGPVIAGVIGHRQYLFDVWGDTVNTAARIESLGIPNAVNVSRDVWRQVVEQCSGESCGLVQLRGKREEIELFRVDKVLSA